MTPFVLHVPPSLIVYVMLLCSLVMFVLVLICGQILQPLHLDVCRGFSFLLVVTSFLITWFLIDLILLNAIAGFCLKIFDNDLSFSNK